MQIYICLNLRSRKKLNFGGIHAFDAKERDGVSVALCSLKSEINSEKGNC